VDVTPYLQDPDVTLHQGDSLEVLRSLPDASVHMACTSPPFFGLRDYQAEGQIGLESSPDEWAARLVDVFREVRRVLRDDGTLWVECGDSYASSGKATPQDLTERHEEWMNGSVPRFELSHRSPTPVGLKQKDLIGQPWLLAFALRADGWYLRSCIIWSKPNAMPESVTDRPTTGHSYVFLFSKRPRYFYDAEALREAQNWQRPGAENNPQARQSMRRLAAQQQGAKPATFPEVGRLKTHNTRGDGGSQAMVLNPAGKNARTVWTIPTEPNALAICRVCDAYWQGGAPREHCGEPVVQHFAAFPRELVRRMILAGTSERGVCGECGAPWVREVESTPREDVRPSWREVRLADGFADGKGGAISRFGSGLVTETLGWFPSCFPSCPIWLRDPHEPNPRASLEPVPATVLDPFSGSGTTLLVARSLGRHSVGIELNERYCAMTRARLSQLSLLSELA
jgi:DNA modification methylase